jgi:hypothetical protein
MVNVTLSAKIAVFVLNPIWPNAEKGDFSLRTNREPTRRLFHPMFKNGDLYHTCPAGQAL